LADDAKAGMPRHIGIIMDGNGRWAKRRGQPRTFGHIRGAEVFKTITRHCEKLGIKALTVYAFSTENWSRPGDEVEAIMGLFRRYLVDAFDFTGENIKINFMGDRAALAGELRGLMARLEDESRGNTGLILNIALNYGGRAEIVSAARKLAEKAAAGALSPGDIDEIAVENELYTAGQPPVDIILRPSGEHRISNFMLWQCAYSEFIYMDTLWPDFTPELLDMAIEEYRGRSRRFGGVQVNAD
jgi:undecaprenyl diphosphate synthase